MTYYLKLEKNIYGIDTVAYYSTSSVEPYDVQTSVEPKLGQYYVNGNLISDEEYDAVIAPIIQAQHQPLPEQEPEQAPVPEATEPAPPPEPVEAEPVITLETISELESAISDITKLITVASVSTNYDGNFLVLKNSIRTGEEFAEPKRINIIEENIANPQQYIDRLIVRKNAMEAELATKKARYEEINGPITSVVTQ